MATELWKDVVGYEGSYEVSDFGRVRSLDRRVPCANGKMRSVRGRVLKQTVGNHTYHVVSLCKANRKRVDCVHVMVAKHFIGPRPNGLHVCHDDGNKARNELSNLRYDTPAANVEDTVAQGRSRVLEIDSVGEANGNAKLRLPQVIAIKARISSGESLKAISRDYPQVSYSAIKRINQGKVWANV
jgi:hypothetical protein